MSRLKELMQFQIPRHFLSTLLLGTALVASSQAGKRDVIVSTADTLVPSGQTATISMKLERKGFGFGGKAKAERKQNKGIWRADLPGRTVRFFYDDTELAERVTDDEGEASFTWTPPGEGNHTIRIEFAGDKKYAPGFDDAMVSVKPADTRLVILDIDHTLSHTSNKNVIKGSIADKPLEHSKAVADRLEAKYGIVYVSARSNKFLDVTKRWLAHYGYPRRPVYFLDIKDYPTYNEAQYKIDTFAGITGNFPNTWLGVGDKKSDAKAYRTYGLRTLILGDSEGVEGAEEVADWHEVESLLFDERLKTFKALNQIAE